MAELVITFIITAALIAWHYFGGKASGKADRRSALWEKRKKHYYFDHNTDEWYRIKRSSVSGGIILESTPRTERLLQEDRSFRNRVFFLAPVLHFIGIGSAVVGIELCYTDPFDVAQVFFITVGTSLTGVLIFEELQYRTGRSTGRGAMVIDPAPRQPENKPFGPKSVSQSTDHPGATDLTYKPHA